MEHIVTTQNLSKYYGKIAALHDVNINIAPGQIVGLFGANGAGKTTLLKAISGLTHFTGSITTYGFTPPYKHRAPLFEHIAFVPDTNILPEWASIKTLVRFYHDLYPHFDKAQFQTFFQRLAIEDTRKIATLSKGQRAQVFLFLSMSLKMPLLILDEPTLGLDPIAKEAFYKILIEDYFDHTRSIIISSHHLEELNPYLNHVLLIKQGCIIQDQSVETLESRYHAFETISHNSEAFLQYQPCYHKKGLSKELFIYQNLSPQNIEALSELGNKRNINLNEFYHMHYGA